MEDVYANIRELIGDFIGKRIAEITQHDIEDFKETGRSYVMLHFDDGSYLKFFVGDDGFEGQNMGE